MFRSSDNGNTWEGTIFSERDQSNDSPAAAIDGDGNLYVVYAARGANAPQGEPPNSSEVYFQRSTDGGDTWSGPVNLTDDDPVGDFDRFLPGISVAPNGRIDVKGPLAWAGLGAGVALAVAGIGLFAMRSRPSRAEVMRQ